MNDQDGNENFNNGGLAGNPEGLSEKTVDKVNWTITYTYDFE